jgi:hypothetical protein
MKEPLLVIGGSLGALCSLVFVRQQPLYAGLGLAALSLWLFFGRGGVTLTFYLLTLLPLLSLTLGLSADVAAKALHRLCSRIKLLPVKSKVLQYGAALFCLGGITYGYGYFPSGSHDPLHDFHADPLCLWKNRQAEVHRQAAAWIIRHVPRDSYMIIDQSIWLELHDVQLRDDSTSNKDIPEAERNFEHAHYYWKVAQDPAIRNDVFFNDWRRIDYIVTTEQLREDIRRENRNGKFSLIIKALTHSKQVAAFDTGGWPIRVYRVEGEIHKSATFERTGDMGIELRHISSSNTLFADGQTKLVVSGSDD